MSPAHATYVEFPGFRQYEATRQDANNALMALLAGSKLAAHTLQLTQGSRQLLPEIFPGVDQIGYFRLRTNAATALLQDVGHHLGAVAVPYVLALHEDFITTTLELLESRGLVQRAPGRSTKPEKNPVKAWNMHEAVYLTLGLQPPAGGTDPDLEVFHLLREMRNCQIHEGRKVSARFQQQAQAMSGAATNEWVRIARRTPQDVITSQVIHFTTFDIFAVLANAKRLGRKINTLLRDRLPRADWAAIAVDDYAANSSKQPRSDVWGRGLLGHTSKLYGVLNLADTEVLAAATAAGFWTPGRQIVPRRSARAGRRPRDRGSHPSQKEENRGSSH